MAKISSSNYNEMQVFTEASISAEKLLELDIGYLTNIIQ